jgi:glycosyltransferase involved in cell wall biosynthesis
VKRLSIVHLITGLGAGGAEHVLLRLASSTRRDRFSSLVVSLMPEGPLAAPMRAAGVEVQALGMTPAWPSPRAVWRLVRLLRARRPDVLQTWLYHADLLGLLAARLSGVRTVIWNVRASDVDMSRYRAQSSWTLDACARMARSPRAVVVNSNAGRLHHQRLGYRPREWIVIPNGIDVSAFRPDDEARRSLRAELGIPANAPVVGLIARFDPMKDHETFLRAASQLAATHGEVVFVLAGEGVSPDSAAFGALLSRTAPHARVIALGRREDVPRVAAACDVSTCSSSFGEGFPNAVIESMACGVPCVVTDVGDAGEIVGDTGLVVPRRDPAALAAGWERLLAMPAPDRVSLGARARQRVIERYTLARMVAAYEGIYERLA